MTSRWLLLLGCVAATSAGADLHPIVEVESGFLLGATSGGKWLKAEKTAKLLPAAMPYSVYSLTQKVGETTAIRAKSAGEPCPETMAVTLTKKPEHGIIALAAPWNALPRKPRLADPTQQVYINAVADVLRQHGISQPKVKISRILRVDLDGDAEDEVLISASNYFSKDESVPSFARAGSYSVVLLRRVVNGRVQTVMMAGETYAETKEFNAPNEYEIAAVLDLDGDGKMEIIVGSHYYEGGATTIYRCDAGKVTEVLSVSCGA